MHVLHDPPLDGPTNMARDEHLLYSDSLRPAALRLYGWTPPTISLGYFQRYDEFLRQPEEVRNLAVVRRTTGGGAILHDREVTYCLVLDESLPITTRSPVTMYRLVHEAWLEAVAVVGPRPELAPDDFPSPSPRSGPFFCFEKPGRTDLLIGGKKLLGSAQRRIPGRVLQHGSLLVGQRFAAHPGAHLGEPLPDVLADCVTDFIARLAAALTLEPRQTEWTVDQLADVGHRRQRYADNAWTRRR